MDKLTPDKRSENMSKIRSVNTKPELSVRLSLFKEGYRYRINVNSLPGKPDIVLRRYRTAIFVNGCFWHNHKCSDVKIPSTRTSWWVQKLSKTSSRDKINIEELIKSGWKVIVIWNCGLDEIKKTGHNIGFILKKMLESDEKYIVLDRLFVVQLTIAKNDLNDNIASIPGLGNR